MWANGRNAKKGMEEKPMKKLLALVIALCMVLGATSAFADGLLKIGYVQVGAEDRLCPGWT